MLSRAALGNRLEVSNGTQCGHKWGGAFGTHYTGFGSAFQ